MSGRYDIIFPSGKRQLFDGGKDNKFERSIIPDNESPDCANVIFSNGAVETRGGSSRLNTTAVGSFACDGLYTRRDNTTAETMCAWFNGTMYTLATTTFSTLPSAQSVFTAGVRVGAAQYENHIFFGNGGSTPYKYNGAHFTRHGVPTPASASTATSNGAGNLAGSYSWRVTFVNSQSVEGNVGPAVTFTVTSTGGKVLISSLPTAPISHGVNARRIYRTDAGGSTYHRVVEISDNTTLTYDDNIASSAVGVTAPTDHGEPPNYSTVIYHQNRLFVNDPTNLNFVNYSGIAEPFTFGALDFFRVGDATSDLVKGFAAYDSHLMVLCENSEFLVYMPSTDATTWSILPVKSAYGSKSPFGIVRYNDKILFPAMQNSKFVGFAAVKGTAVEPSATLLTVSVAGSELQSQRIEPDMFLIPPAQAGNISSLVYKNKAYITLPYGANQTTNNRVYIFDFSISDLSKDQKEAWSLYTGITASQLTIYGGSLYGGDSLARGFVYQLETSSYIDVATAVDSYYWTKEYSGNPGHANLEKDFRKVRLLVENAGAYYMNLTYRLDSDKGSGTTVQISLNPGSSLWNTARWGTDLWGGGTDQQEVTVSLSQARGKRIQFMFSNQNATNQRFKVHGMNFTYNLRGVR